MITTKVAMFTFIKKVKLVKMDTCLKTNLLMYTYGH